MVKMIRKSLLTIIASATVSSAVWATDMVNFQTSGGVDFAAFGYGGMRGAGTGTINVAGVSGTVSQAILYWHGPTNDTVDPNVNAIVNFAGTSVTGTHIGESNQNCWSFSNTHGYRADVTGLVSGNGAYSLSNFTKGAADINGVSLFLIYDDANPANNTDLVIFDGNDSNQTFAGELDGWNATLSGLNYSSGTANMLMVVADGQAFSDHGVDLNGTMIFPSNTINFAGNTVPNGPSAATTSGGLWDHKNVNVTSLLSPGPNTLTLTTDGTGVDCHSLVSLAFTFPAGTVVPVTPTQIPTLNQWGLITLASLLALFSWLGIGKNTNIIRTWFKF